MKSIPLVLTAAVVLAASCKKEESYLEKRERERAEKSGQARVEKTQKPEQETSEKEKPVGRKSADVAGSNAGGQDLSSVREVVSKFQLARAELNDSRRKMRRAKLERKKAGTLTDEWLKEYSEAMRKSDVVWRNAGARESLERMLPGIEDPPTAAFVKAALKVDQHLSRSDECATEIERLQDNGGGGNVGKILELSNESLQELLKASKLTMAMRQLLRAEAGIAPE